MRRAFHWIVGLLAIAFLGSAIAGAILGGGILHPARRALDGALIAQANDVFARDGAVCQEFDVSAQDGVILRGWKARAKSPNGHWVMLFHGHSDNRVGTISYADFLLRAGYSVVMMDARAHGASGGTMATYGWKERWDTKSIVAALYDTENPRRLFALGESMGAAIALQSAAVEPRISAVVAEASFSNLREVTYDYAGLQFSPWLGKTLFRPATIVALRAAEKEGGFRGHDVSPEEAVSDRAFPVLLICGTLDRRIPCRHARRIFRAATGPKKLWVVRGAQHTGAYGIDPAEFKRRVLVFFAAYR
ncbi:MAG TPA: alpha/beta fold hydrolase [Candidatus Acidoferrales bacterium]|nr:alpha/beta fold hydrolase [Candidatus Acidoferrales bacterium]